MKITRTDNSTLTVDIHGMRERDAKFRLESLIDGGSADITKLIVIHGFNSGQVLKNLVATGLESNRIKKIVNGENSGQTVILLKGKK
ncbi:MAG: Smr/MutS family protein [Clostridia bacterium]|nr:Smr/MutS family protein [Clostridia bacterium]